MTKPTNIHRYRSELIRPCAYATGEHKGRWYVVSYHTPTGMQWEDSVCQHYQTLAEARSAIDETSIYNYQLG